METDNSAARFLACLSQERRAAVLGQKDELERVLIELLATAHHAHPGVELTDEPLIEALAATVAANDVIEEIEKIHVADVFVARAAAKRDRAALEHVQALLAAEVAAAASSVHASGSVADEVRQRLVEHLLVGATDRAPAITEYAGRGPIRGFFRVCAVRECLRLIKRERREIGIEPDELVRDGAQIDPEIERLKLRYREQFNKSFAAALLELTPRERTLLRQQTIDRLSIDQIGAIYGVHRATAARWLERARARVAELTETMIAEQMLLDSAEVASVIRLVSSQLDVSLERLLGDGER